MIILIAKVRIRPEKVELYEKAFKALQAKVYANEPGVTFYELCRDPGAPNAYTMVEAYKDEAVQDHHITTEYYKAMSPNMLTYVQGDHMEEITKRGLTNPADMYPLVKTLSVEYLQPI